MSPEFLLTSLIIVATPGTGALFTIAAGLSRGAPAGILAAFASTLGIVPHVAAAMFGLAALLHSSAVAFDFVKYAGVAYLLWMAWQSLAGAGALSLARDERKPGAWRVLLDGVALNLPTRSSRSSSSRSCRSSLPPTRRRPSAPCSNSAPCSWR